MHLLHNDQGTISFNEVRKYRGDPFYLAMKNFATELMVMVRMLSNNENPSDYDDIYFYINTDENTGYFEYPCIMLYSLKSFEQADAIIQSFREALEKLTTVNKGKVIK